MTISKDYKKEIYRKSIHLSSLWMPAFIWFAPSPYPQILFLIMLIVDFMVEYFNYKGYKLAQKLFMLFSPTLRNKELQHKRFTPTGSVYVLLSAFLCSFLFAKPIAVIALSVMLISDTCAALVGKACGKHKIYKQKSWEGTFAFFASAIAVMLFLSPIYAFSAVGVIACLMATLVELFEEPLKIDDNLSIPLIIAGVLTFL